MDTNVIIAIVAVVVIAAILVIGGWWLGKTRKNAVDKSTEDAKAKADARLAAEAKSAAADSSTVKPSVDSNVDAAEKAPAESQQKSSAQASSSETAAPAPATEARPEPAHETPESAGTRMQRLKARLSKSGNPFGKALFNILAKDQLSEADWEDVEDTLLLADVGAEASEQLVEELRNDARIAGQSDPAEVRAALKDKLLKLVGTDTDRRLNANKEGANKPSVIIMVGVNGTGKTTTAGKLSRLLVSEGKQVMLGAADTFRAAAADQLETWGAKVGVPVVRSDKDGADPASVAFEASAKAKEENADVLIIDTAGRLQNKANLMDELGKIRYRKEPSGRRGAARARRHHRPEWHDTGQGVRRSHRHYRCGALQTRRLRKGRHRDFRAERAWRARQARRPRRRPGRSRPVRSRRLRRRHPRLS